MERQRESYERCTGQNCAAWLKYFLQFSNSRIEKPLPVYRVFSQSLYCRNKKAFDKFAAICQKLDIPFQEVLKHIADIKKQSALDDIESSILSREQFISFAQKKAIEIQRKKVFKEIVSSADKLSDICIKQHYSTCIDLLKKIVREKKLAGYYLSGAVSKYLLSAMPKLEKLVSFQDSLSRDELKAVCERKEKYNIDMCEAMSQELHKIVSPFKIVDCFIAKKLRKTAKQQQQKQQQ